MEKTYVHFPKTGRNFFPKNLGWLIAHRGDNIRGVKVRFLPKTGGAYLTVSSSDWVFRCEFASYAVAIDWINRHLFKRGWVNSSTLTADTWYMLNMYRQRPDDFHAMVDAGVMTGV